MTRLINADRLKKSFEANTPIAFQDCVPGIHSVIDLEPTVEAIPVEWIRKYTEENRLYQSDDFDLYISDMIADWAERKEE